tara:strand:- start:24627 stop:26069 length:1443 start_codon:yes stop_codon:yes gene_type:complete
MKKIFFLIFTFVFSSVLSQDGSLDTSFGDNGISFIDFGSDLIHVGGINEFSDGSYQVVARRSAAGVGTLLFKFLSNGTLDLSYGDNGIITYPHTIFELPQKTWTVENDKTLLYTEISGVGGAFRRYLNDGSLDTTFGNNGELNPFPAFPSDFAAYLNENNKIVFSYRDGLSVIIKVFDLEGNPDTSFGNNGELSISINLNGLSVTNTYVRPNLDIFLTLYYLENGTRKYAILKYLENGSLVTSFGDNGEVTIPSYSDNHYSFNYLSFFEDDSILINSESLFGGSAVNRLFKINSSGIYFTSFGDNGVIQQYNVGSVIIQPNQRFLSLYRDTGWEFFGGPMYMNRYYAGGDLDASFQFNTNDVPEVFDVRYLIDSQGNVVVTASEIDGRNLLVFRLNNNPLNVSDFEANSFTVSPNPSSSEFVINSTFPFENEYFQVFDMTGKQIKEGFLFGENPSIDLSHFDTGIYFLKFENTTAKLVKQ